VAVLALGTGTTLGSVALHPEVERIDVLEISPAVVDAAPWFEAKNRGVLKDRDRSPAGARRVRVLLGDGRYTLARHPSDYDVITMEPLLPDSPFAVYLYTREFYARARAALAPGGLVCQWVPPHALEPQTFAAVLDAFSASFDWSSVWLFGTQVILLGGERQPVLDPARFTAADPELERALADLGIGTPSGLLARFVAESSPGSSSPPSSISAGDSARALTDADPWIAYRPRRRGAVLLGDLPANLRALREREGAPPASWLAAAGPDGSKLLAGVRALHAAREAHAREEARLRGAAAESAAGDPQLAPALARARALCAADPELGELEREIQFLSALRRGIAALSADRSRAGAEAALPDLLQAAELRRERCDVHLYMATALSRMGSPAAPKALEAALARSPRAAWTAEGRRARDLGLADDLWQRAELAADAAPAREP
jgi:spermidine synthase